MIPISVPLPAELSPITKPVVAPIATAATLWRRVHLEVVALLDLVGEEEAAEQGGGPDHQQAAGEDGENRLVELLSPSLPLQVVEEPDAERAPIGTLPIAIQ